MLGEVPSLKDKTVKVTPHPNSTPSGITSAYIETLAPSPGVPCIQFYVLSAINNLRQVKLRKAMLCTHI